jgi:SAM-dependent methyltransferase
MKGRPQPSPYEDLYAAKLPLWPPRPGRMVVQAAKLLPPGKALDLGCGDGKNILFLEQQGWHVDGIDISAAALRGARQRLQAAGVVHRGTLEEHDVATMKLCVTGYDLVVTYGLYHCLDDAQLANAHQLATNALRRGGLLAMAAFNDQLPIPSNHGTPGVRLRPKHHIASMMAGWREIALEFGYIEEDHLPVVGSHKHALTWALFEKP